MSLFSRSASSRGQPMGIFSDRSLTQAAGLLAGVLPGGQGTPPMRGTPEYLWAYGQMPWLRAVTGRIASAVARVGWQLYVVKGQGEPKARAKDAQAIEGRSVAYVQRAPMRERRGLLRRLKASGELTPISQHPLLELLHVANDFHTGFALRKVTQLHLDLVGDAFWLKERDAQGTPTAVWPIPPSWIMNTPTPRFRFFRVSFMAWRGLIPDTEWVWFSDVNPANPYGRGSGTAMALGDELETDEYAARMSKSFFYNSARPDMLIWPKGGANLLPAQVRRLEEDWLANAQGVFRAFRPYFMTREVEVKELDVSFRSQQFVQLRQFERDVVLQHFGVPPEVLGVITNSNRSTIGAADYFFDRYVAEPRVEFQRQTMQERLVPEYDDRLILDYEPFVAEDDEKYLDAAKAAPWALTVDEWRALGGHAPMGEGGGGALHMVPFTISPQQLGERESASGGGPPAGPAPIPGGEDVPQRAWPVGAAWLAAARDAADGELEGALRHALAPTKGLPALSVAAARLEVTVARGLVRVWRQHRAVVDEAALRRALMPHGVEGDAVDALQVLRLGTSQSQHVQPLLVAGLLRGAAFGAEALRARGIPVRESSPPQSRTSGIGVDLAGMNPVATQWARAHAAALVQGSAEARELIRDMVAEANAWGVTVPELARAIREVIGLRPDQGVAVARFLGRLTSEGVAESTRTQRVARYAEAQTQRRAMTIARTETIAALNNGQQILWDQAVAQGAIQAEAFRKTWIVTDDDRLDEICEDNAAEDVALDEDFPSGDSVPPAHPNCLVHAMTPVYTSTGWKPVKDIVIGDMVLTHRGRFRTVTQLHRGASSEPTIRLRLHNRRHALSVTANHPVRVACGKYGQWVTAELLKPGDKVRCAEQVVRVAANHGEEFAFGAFRVIAVERIIRKQPYATFNLSVADDESYIAKGVAVHNCRCAVGLVDADRG